MVGLLFLLLCNALFSMGEIALVSSRKTRLEDRAKRGNPGAKAALILLAHPERLLSTVQVGITSVSTLAGAFGGVELSASLAQWLIGQSIAPSVAQPAALLAVVGAITFLSLIFGELIPKSIALNNPEPVAMIAAPVLVGMATITHPLIRILTWITSTFLRWVGLGTRRTSPISEEEVQLLIDEGVQHGVIEQEESDMIKSVFRFDDRRAQDMMIHRQQLSWINLSDPSEKIRRQIVESDFSKFLVCDGDLEKLVGILYVKDYIKALEDTDFPNINDLVAPPLFIPETMSGLKILEKFRHEKRYVGVVVNEHGGVEGWITLHDLIESILGDLPDSRDPDTREFFERPDGSWLVDGAVLLDDLNETLNLDIERVDRGYSTLGGLMMDCLNRVPRAGDTFTGWGTQFEVLDMDGHRVDKVLIKKIMEQSEDAE